MVYSLVIIILALFFALIDWIRGRSEEPNKWAKILFWLGLFFLLAISIAQVIEIREAKRETAEIIAQNLTHQHTINRLDKKLDSLIRIIQSQEGPRESRDQSKDLLGTLIDRPDPLEQSRDSTYRQKEARALLDSGRSPEEVIEKMRKSEEITEIVRFMFREYQTRRAIPNLVVEFDIVYADPLFHVVDTTDILGYVSFRIPKEYINDICEYTVLGEEYEENGKYVSISDLVKGTKEVYLKRKK